MILEVLCLISSYIIIINNYEKLKKRMIRARDGWLLVGNRNREERNVVSRIEKYNQNNERIGNLKNKSLA